MNYLEYQFDQALNIIISANKIDISRTNPASEGKKAIFKLDEFAKDNNIDLFEGDNYLKYIYIGFIEAALEEMGDCLNNMVLYSEGDFFKRLKNKAVVFVSMRTYCYDMISLKGFDINLVGKYIKILLLREG